MFVAEVFGNTPPFVRLGLLFQLEYAQKLEIVSPSTEHYISQMALRVVVFQVCKLMVVVRPDK